MKPLCCGKRHDGQKRLPFVKLQNTCSFSSARLFFKENKIDECYTGPCSVLSFYEAALMSYHPLKS